MIKQARDSQATEFVVATEIGILHRLQKENPQKTFHPIDNEMSCRYMKMITLEKLHASLKDQVFQVTVDPATASRARQAIERMISIF
jgi:quinolinate synthase